MESSDYGSGNNPWVVAALVFHSIPSAGCALAARPSLMARPACILRRGRRTPGTGRAPLPHEPHRRAWPSAALPCAGRRGAGDWSYSIMMNNTWNLQDGAPPTSRFSTAASLRADLPLKLTAAQCPTCLV
eukprot:SAG11_NODE_217_length_12229_cov_9.152185_3_plen_130_part_00